MELNQEHYLTVLFSGKGVYMSYKNPKDMTNEEIIRYCLENNLVVIENGENPYFMDADDYYLNKDE